MLGGLLRERGRASARRGRGAGQPEKAALRRLTRRACERTSPPAGCRFRTDPGRGGRCGRNSKRDGRAAVAIRLGIRETTVRSHLSAIFDKLDIHRRAELMRIVAER